MICSEPLLPEAVATAIDTLIKRNFITRVGFDQIDNGNTKNKTERNVYA